MDPTFKTSINNMQYARDIMPLWIDGAKNFAATSSAALGLTIVFKEKVLGNNTARMRTNSFLVGSWVSYFLCIGCSVFYQWMAVHWSISLRANPETNERPPYYPFGWSGPHYIYGAMMILFVLGSFLLVVSAARELGRKDETHVIEESI
jgi:hypothetical protein